MSKQVSLTNIIGVKELRQNLDKYAKAVARGQSFTVVKRSKPMFNISSPVTDPFGDEGHWKTVVDFTEIDPDGVPIEEVLSALQRIEKRAEKKEKNEHEQNRKVSPKA